MQRCSLLLFLRTMCLTIKSCLPFRLGGHRGQMTLPPQHNGKTKGGNFFRLPKQLRRNTKTSSSSNVTNATDAVETHRDEISFEQNLEHLRLSEAGKQLIDREERLFGGTDPLECPKDQVDQLAEDHKTLLGCVTQALRESLDPAKEEGVEVLKSAVKALLQEAEQDKRWVSAERRSQTSPAWRPSRWRRRLDTTLQTTVEERMDAAGSVVDQAEGRSSVQMEIDGKGKRIKEDLQRVVEVLRDCYPVEIDICNHFARLYHQDFSSRLSKIADFVLNENDCAHVLRWMNDYYPNILKQYEKDINCEALGKLLSEKVYKPMEEQYLTNSQVKVQKLIKLILKKEVEAWMKGDKPEFEEYYSSPLAIDVVQCLNGTMRSAEVYLGDQQKALAVMCLLEDFLQSFKKFHEDVIKGTSANSKPVMMANLICVEQFRDYIIKKTSLFPEEVRENCLSTLTAMKESGYAYLLSPMHKDLKPQYRKLGTSEWLNRPLFEELLNSVEKRIQDLKGLNEFCHQELMGRLEREVTSEYVTRLLKDKVKLKNKEKQEQAARTVTENGHSLHELFSKVGSREDWLADILPKIAEVLKLQDLPSIQMEVASLATFYPDLSDKHVIALLKLKTNLSNNDREKVKAAFQDSLAEINHQDAQPFFSKILIK